MTRSYASQPLWRGPGSRVAAVRRQDSDRVRSVAHLLNGSRATLGATRLSRCCERVEHHGRGEPDAVGETQIALLRVAAAEASQALRKQLA